MNLELNHFKNELSDYYYLKSKIAKIEDAILELDVKRGISAVRYDKEATQGSQDKLMVELNKLNDIDKYDKLQSDLMYYQERLDRITAFLKFSEVGDSILKIHCLGTSTYEKESRKLFMVNKTLKRRVNKDIMDYLKM